MRTIGHIPPDMTLSKAEIDADRSAWKALEDDVARLRSVLDATHKLIAEGAMTGFNPHNGTWADRLFKNQWNISQALK